MAPLMVRVAHVVHLETERVLQVIPGLLSLQAGDDGRPFGDVHDHQTTRLGQRTGDLPYLTGRRQTVCTAHRSS
jgi:hypothetical protein